MAFERGVVGAVGQVGDQVASMVGRAVVPVAVAMVPHWCTLTVAALVVVVAVVAVVEVLLPLRLDVDQFQVALTDPIVVLRYQFRPLCQFQSSFERFPSLS